MERPAWVEIDVDALAYNMEQIKNKVGNRKVMAVVKADGYGHGAVECAKIFLAHGADCLAVSMLGEALELRKAGILCPILILGWTPQENFADALEQDIILAIDDLDDAKALNSLAQRLQVKAKVHIKIDTGMTRLGIFPNEDGLQTIQKILALEHLSVDGIFSHFSKADEQDKTYAKLQLKRFLYVLEQLEQKGCVIPCRHIANSAAIMELPEAYLDMVRPGIILYGLYPSEEVDRTLLKLRPAMRVCAKASRAVWVEEETLVGYGGSYRTSKKTKVVTIPIGYADGYRRHFSNVGTVAAQDGTIYPIIGKICMDQCMIDATAGEVQKGDTIFLLHGEIEEITAEAIAKRMGTISYEIVCDFALRLKRIYCHRENETENRRIGS